MRVDGRRARRPGEHLQLRPQRLPLDARDGGARPGRARPPLPRRRARAAEPAPRPAGPAWPVFHDIERTLDALSAHLSGRGRRLPPLPGRRDPRGRARWSSWPTSRRRPVPCLRRVAGRRARGVHHLLRWSRRSVGDVLQDFFTRGRGDGARGRGRPGRVGALPVHARHRPRRTDLRHEARRRRSAGRSAAVAPSPTRCAARSRPRVAPLRTGAHVAAILCEGERVRGVELADGTVIEAPDRGLGLRSPHDVRAAGFAILRPRPRRSIDRWQAAPGHDGYESQGRRRHRRPCRPTTSSIRPLPDRLGYDPLHATTIVAPPLDEMAAAHRLMADGRVAEQPMFFANVPSVLDPSLRVDGRHVFSLEVLYTPYATPGRLDRERRSPQRWLERLRRRCVSPGFLDGVRRWRAMTPGRLRAGLLPAAGVRHELRRRAARRAAGQGPRADPLRDTGEGAVPHRRGHVPGRRRVGGERPQRGAGHPLPEPTPVAAAPVDTGVGCGSGVLDGGHPLADRDRSLVAPREVDPQVGPAPHVLAVHHRPGLLVQDGAADLRHLARCRTP